VTDPEVAASSGVEHGTVLLAFAEAMVGEDEDALTHVRHAVIEVMSPAAMVDAAGVASNFERMVRIADATGIPLDARMQVLSQEVRDALHLERFTVHKEVERDSGKRMRC
jgi:hypothetical protein